MYKLSAMKGNEWIIKVYNSLAGPVLECEGGAALHFLFKCFKCIKVSTLGKWLSVTVVHALSVTTTKTTYLMCFTDTQRIFLDFTLLCVTHCGTGPSRPLKSDFRIHAVHAQEVLNGAILTSCNVISPTYSSVTSLLWMCWYFQWLCTFIAIYNH